MPAVPFALLEVGGEAVDANHELVASLPRDDQIRAERGPCVEMRAELLQHKQGFAVDIIDGRLPRGIKLLKEIAGLKVPRGEAGETARRHQNHFAHHAGRMSYQAMADRGWPIGRGSVESTCRQDQGRFERPGQFWTERGFRYLMYAGRSPSKRSRGSTLADVLSRWGCQDAPGSPCPPPNP